MRRYALMQRRFSNAHAIDGQAGARISAETHAPRSKIGDPRQIHGAAARPAQGPQRPRVHFIPHRSIKGDAAQWLQPVAVARWARCAHRPGGVPQAQARYVGRAADGAGCAARLDQNWSSREALRWPIGSAKKGASPKGAGGTVALGPEQQVGPPEAGKAFCTGQTCTVLRTRMMVPWVHQLGSRGIPARCRTPQATP